MKSRSGINRTNGEEERVLPDPCGPPMSSPPPTVPDTLLLPIYAHESPHPPHPSLNPNSKARFRSASWERCSLCRSARPPLTPSASLRPLTGASLWVWVRCGCKSPPVLSPGGQFQACQTKSQIILVALGVIKGIGVCVCVCFCICEYVCECTNECVFVRMRVCVYLCKCERVHTHVCWGALTT